MTKARCVLPACACNAERSASRNFPCGVQCRVGAVDCRYWRSLLASCLTPLPSSSSRKTSANPEMFFGDLFQVFYFCWLQRDWRGVQSWWLAVLRCSFLNCHFLPWLGGVMTGLDPHVVGVVCQHRLPCLRIKFWSPANVESAGIAQCFCLVSFFWRQYLWSRCIFQLLKSPCFIFVTLKGFLRLTS